MRNKQKEDAFLYFLGVAAVSFLQFGNPAVLLLIYKSLAHSFAFIFNKKKGEPRFEGLDS